MVGSESKGMMHGLFDCCILVTNNKKNIYIRVTTYLHLQSNFGPLLFKAHHHHHPPATLSDKN